MLRDDRYRMSRSAEVNRTEPPAPPAPEPPVDNLGSVALQFHDSWNSMYVPLVF